MHEKSDAQLLREYATHAHEAAFREIVHRHAGLVYSSALRQVTSPDLARDVAQSVFTDLARKAPALAGTLTENSSLLGWLYHSTRFTALNQLRDDRRRLARERQVMQHFDPSADPAPDWDQVQPVLDEAMADLSDEDRDALLLRFFKNHDFRAIGSALGVSDDTAQKRVSRALERLRTHLTSRGVTTTAVALSTALSTNAAPLAPAGLAAALSTGALTGTALATTATATAIKTLTMTTLQKTLVTATVAVLAGAGIYEARQASQLRDQLQMIEQQQAPLVEQNQQLQRERDAATNRLALLAEGIASTKSNNSELLKLRGEVTQLRSLQRDVIAQKKLATESISGLPEWKPDQVKYVGRATPQDALQTYLWSGNTTNLVEIGNSLVGDENDPPSPDALHEFVNERSNHPFSNDGVTSYRLLSQTMVSASEVRLEINARFGDSGVSVPITLRNVNGAWKAVVFTIRDAEGKVSQLGFVNESAKR